MFATRQERFVLDKRKGIKRKDEVGEKKERGKNYICLLIDEEKIKSSIGQLTEVDIPSVPPPRGHVTAVRDYIPRSQPNERHSWK